MYEGNMSPADAASYVAEEALKNATVEELALLSETEQRALYAKLNWLKSNAQKIEDWTSRHIALWQALNVKFGASVAEYVHLKDVPLKDLAKFIKLPTRPSRLPEKQLLRIPSRPSQLDVRL